MEKRKSSAPIVAIVTRTKNRPLLLERAIKSIAAQSFSDYLIVIVNDGGDLEPVDKLVKKYAKQIYGQIKVVHNTKSVGAGEACNIGITNSESEYITMHDDDDTWHPDFLAETVSYLKRTGDEGVATGSEIIYESIESDTIRTIRQERFAPNIKSINFFSLVGVNQFPIHSFVYSRKALKKVGLYDKGAHPIEDWDFNMRFIRQFDIGFINKPLANYHQRVEAKGSMRNSMSDEGHRDPTTRMLNEYLRKDLKEGKLGLGFLANISNTFHEARMDIKRDQIHQTKMLEAIQETLEHQNRRIDLLESELYRLSHLEQRFKNYVKRLPRRVAKKTLRNEPREK